MDKDRNRMPPPHGLSNGSRSRPPPPPPGHHHSRSSGDSNPQLISIDVFPPKSGPPPRPQVRLRQAPILNGRPQMSERPREFDRDLRRRPRRNSDSSVMDAHEAEQKERERSERRRREQRDQRSKVENGSGSGSRKDERARRDRKKGAPLDVIDKLDVTGIYSVHHDGPFDACNPHRNKKTHKLAPVHAFPADSANNALSGFGPVNLKADHSHVFGNRDPEAFHDFTASGRRDSSPGLIDVRPSGLRAQSFDPKAAETIHGDETVGLGTSTFLDGAPASKVAMERTMSETADDRPQSSNGGMGGGLQRKKSLAQKIRSISQNRPNMGDGSASGHRRPPPPGKSVTEPRYSPTSSSVPPPKNDRNPFFAEYDNAYDRKGEAIAETEKNKGDRVPGSPKKTFKSATADKGSENGLLKRVRSLSKSKRRND